MEIMFPTRLFGCISEMQRADSAGSQPAKHFAENLFPPSRRDVLKDDHGMEEIKFSVEGLQIIDRFGQRNIPHVEFLTIPLRFFEHGVRDVDSGHMPDTAGEREGQSSDAAAEVERSRRSKIRI